LIEISATKKLLSDDLRYCRCMNPRLQLALTLVRQTGVQIARAFEQRSHVLHEKSANDFATETDRAIERQIAEAIAAAFPGDVLLGEEGGERLLGNALATGVRWIVDPLDGTYNFVHGFPYFATSIAIEAGGAVQCGVIGNPLTGEMFSAGLGFGAWRHPANDGEPVRMAVSSCPSLDRALVATVLPSGTHPSFASVLPAWTAIAQASGSVRRTGAAALDLAQVAAGAMDGFFVMSLAAWDAAAGALMVTEAGGRVCDFDGGGRYLQTNQVIAGNVIVVEALLPLLKAHAKPQISSKTE
jgi:myo-inositol-1(or 4)-monophosphatase